EIVYRFLLLIVCRDLGIGEGPESGWLRSVASTSPSRLKRRSTRSTAAGLLHGLARRRRTHSSLDAATRAFDRSRHEVGYSPAGRSSAESHCGRAGRRPSSRSERAPLRSGESVRLRRTTRAGALTCPG